MNTTQPWAGLPDHIKRQAAPDMLAGKTWMYYGNRIEHPGADELRRWVEIAPQSPQAGAESVTSIRAAEPGISQRIARKRTREGKRGFERDKRAREEKPMTRHQKRDAVDRALLANVGISVREIARKLGVSHTFIAMRLRKGGNVAG